MVIFMDQMQDIFRRYTKIPNAERFIKYNLPENCRNTKAIVKYLSNVLNKKIESFDNSPSGGDVVVKSFKNSLEQQKYLIDEIKSLVREQGIKSEQILILINTSKLNSCLGSTNKIGNYDLKSLDNKARFVNDAISYTNINTFKGLEADIVFVLDVDEISENNKKELLYTQASRAMHKLYILDKTNH